MEPELGNLKGVTGAYMYYDCQAPYTERLGIENVISAAENGATIINHARLVGFMRNGNDVSGIKVQDTVNGESYDIKSSLVVNATGHWVDCVRDLLHGRPESIVRRTRGIHLVTRRLCKHGLVLFSDIDNRLFFFKMDGILWTMLNTIGTAGASFLFNLG